MTSAAQVLANRSNGRKSTGPRTPEGKAVASRNAVRHGLLAEQVVIKGEYPAEFECYREGMLRELAPAGAVEEMLAQRVVSLSWRLRRAERLQSAVFARVYRENADDIVLWPKHGLPIQPGPGEDEVILGQVVMTDFAHAQVLDRLLVYERRIESSLYRTMAQLRQERHARPAAEPEEDPRSEVRLPAGQEFAVPAELASFGANAVPEEVARGERRGCGCEARFVQRLREGVSSSGCVGRAPAPRATPVATETGFATAAVNPSATLEGVSRSEGALPAGQEFAAPAELASFGADAAPGVQPVKHRQDADATKAHGRDARATRTLHASPFTLHDRSCETNPILGRVSS